MLSWLIFIIFLVLGLTLKGSALTIFLLLIAAQTLVVALVQLQNYWYAPKRIPIPADAKDLPDIARPAFEQLTALGFHRIGDAEMKLGKKAYPIWVLGDSAGTTCVEITVLGKRFNVEFNSVFPDKAYAETFYVTYYPTLPHIDERNFRMERVTSSLQDTYQRHRQLIEEFGLEHGAPQPVQTINDYVQAQVIFRSLYSRRALRPILIWSVVLPLVWLVTLGAAMLFNASLFGTVSAPRVRPSTQTSILLLGQVVSGLGIFVLLAGTSLLLTGWWIRAQIQNFMLKRQQAATIY